MVLNTTIIIVIFTEQTNTVIVSVYNVNITA